MLRRVARVLRALLLALGLIALLWFPVSFCLWAEASVSTPTRHVQLDLLDGRLSCWWLLGPTSLKGLSIELDAGRFVAEPADRPLIWSFLSPSYNLSDSIRTPAFVYRDISLPLWL